MRGVSVPTKGYTSRDVARFAGLTVAAVRTFARDGVLSPSRSRSGELSFSFQDLVVLRTAQRLAAARIPTRRIRRTLRRLAIALPQGRSLAELRITADGTHIVVSDGEATWRADSGQTELDFDRSPAAPEAATPLTDRLARAAAGDEAGPTAEDWYQRGIDLESTAPTEAGAAYLRALALEAEHPGAHVNLGRLLQEQGRPGEAVPHYHRALAADPAHPTAAFNLAVALEDLGDTVGAIEAYQRALVAEPRLADAHFNLARLYERAGKKAAALRHLSMFRRLAPEP